MARVKSNRGVEIFPGLRSDDKRTLTFLEELAAALGKKLPALVDGTGISGPNGIPSDFLALRNVAGYGMNPMSTPPSTNTPIRSALKLASGFVTKRHERIYSELIRLMHHKARPAKTAIRRAATTGAPHYVSDIKKKKIELVHALQNLDSFLGLVDRDDLAGLYAEFNAPIIHTIFERGQPDSVSLKDGAYTSKPREVNDELAARTGFEQGSRFAADKTVTVNGYDVPGHFAYRRRTVFGMSFVPNYVVAAHFASLREVYSKEYEFTWKHREAASILEKMRRYQFFAGFDVSQFDQSVPGWAVDYYVQEVAKYVDHRLAKLIGLMFKAPYIMPDPWTDLVDGRKTNPFHGAAPFDVASFTNDLGLPSGISNNPDFGKLQMTWQYLCLIDDYYHDVLEVGLDTILRGLHPKYALLNMSDDCVILMQDAAFHAHIVGAKYVASYFKVEPESPISFLGNVPYRTASGELSLAPNLVSFFVNWWVPERGVEHASRRNFWAIGDRERRQHYSKAPGYSDAFVLYEKLFEAAFRIHPSSISASHYDAQRAYSSLGYTDMLVLQRPEVLMYLIDEDQVSPTVLDAVQTTISAEDTWQYTKTTFKETT
jgi:hypothetical protein